MTIFEQLEREMLQQKVAIWRILCDMNAQDMLEKKNKPRTNPNKGKKKIQMRKG